MHMFLERRPPAFLRRDTPAKILHFASEWQVRRFMDDNPSITVVSTDITLERIEEVPGAGIMSDIQNLPFPDESFNGILNVHVLEHVPDDRRAVHEMYRILEHGGEAVIMVPFMMDHLETREYGAPDPFMFDHVRGYSPLDFKERLAPFSYEEVLPASFLSEEELTRFRIPRESQVIYVCRKD